MKKKWITCIFGILLCGLLAFPAHVLAHRDTELPQGSDIPQNTESQQSARSQQTSESQQSARSQQTSESPRSARSQQTSESPRSARTQQSTEPVENAEAQMTRSEQENLTDNSLADLRQAYQAYEERFAAIKTLQDIDACGYDIIEDQSFPVYMESFCENPEEVVTFVPIMDRAYHRLGILLADSEGNVLYKTNRLETNYKCMGQLEQPTKDIAAVSFQDLNLDGLTDIILITNCENTTGEYAGETYKIGDVLFQQEKSFYRDWRISDKINRFSMNKSAKFIASYVRDGNSTEILYTATTLDELLDNGFQIIKEQSYSYSFEKQGVLKVVPGIIRMSVYDVFMIYLTNEQGDIVWSFQPMENYDNLYALRGISCKDLDGDGMKDIVVLARYSYAGLDGEFLIDTKCSIYYQRTDGFAEDKEFCNTYECTEESKVSELVEIIREYWGWPKEDDKDTDSGR